MAATHGEGSSARRVVLVGLSGAGKSTVGALVAQALGWPFVDLDAAIAARAGRPVAGIFAAEGEAGFRARERAETVAVMAREGPLVIATGGGWVEHPEHVRLFSEPGVLGVHLEVSAAAAADRVTAGDEVRPLLGGADARVRLEEQWHRRNAMYLQANHTVSTNSRSPAEVALSIVALASAKGPD